MTTFVIAMLVIACIVLVGRYYGSSSLASNLLLTLAFSVVVGLGIRFVTNKPVVKKETKIEKFVTTNPVSTQSVAVLQADTTANSGAASKVQDWIVKNNSTGDQQQVITPFLSWNRGSPPFPDSS